MYGGPGVEPSQGVADVAWFIHVLAGASMPMVLNTPCEAFEPGPQYMIAGGHCSDQDKTLNDTPFYVCSIVRENLDLKQTGQIQLATKSSRL